MPATDTPAPKPANTLSKAELSVLVAASRSQINPLPGNLILIVKDQDPNCITLRKKRKWVKSENSLLIFDRFDPLTRRFQGREQPVDKDTKIHLLPSKGN